MITEIGIVAGEIWHYLDHHGDSSLDDLVKGLERNRDNVLMSVGWLARESHVILKCSDNGYMISLRKEV